MDAGEVVIHEVIGQPSPRDSPAFSRRRWCSGWNTNRRSADFKLTHYLILSRDLARRPGKVIHILGQGFTGDGRRSWLSTALDGLSKAGLMPATARALAREGSSFPVDDPGEGRHPPQEPCVERELAALVLLVRNPVLHPGQPRPL